jgi:hypothetical protein
MVWDKKDNQNIRGIIYILSQEYLPYNHGYFPVEFEMQNLAGRWQAKNFTFVTEI